MTKGVIYDLDGTIIDTVHVHEIAWQAVASSIGARLSGDMLVRQKGMNNEAAAQLMFPSQSEKEVGQLVQKKNEYVASHFGNGVEARGIREVIGKLRKEGYQVWICTSAPKDFVIRVASSVPLVDSLKDNTVWREMCKEAKPSPEPLFFTLKQMGLRASEAIFVGDALSDYQASKATEIPFLYFAPVYSEQDAAIPIDIPRLENHEEIFAYLNIK